MFASAFEEWAFRKKRRRKKNSPQGPRVQGKSMRGSGGSGPYNFEYRYKPRSRFWMDSDTSTFWSKWHGTHNQVTYQSKHDSLDLSRSNPRSKKGYYTDGGDFYVRHRWLTYTATGYPVKMWEAWNGNALAATWSKPIPTCGGRARSILTLPDVNVKQELDDLAREHYATGIARTNPVRPDGNLAQAIIELTRGGLQGVGAQLISWKNQSSHRTLLGSIGGEWLNLQFGVLPTMGDAVQAVSTLLHIQTLIDKLRKNEGKPVRKKKVLKDVTTVTVDYSTEGWGVFKGTTMYNTGGDLTPDCRTTETKLSIRREKVWFVGKYVYYLPPDTPLGNTLLRAKVGGIYPTLSTIWQTTSWSWLAGWFSNVNSVVQNISDNATERKITLYAYLMQEIELRELYTYTTTKVDWAGNVGYPSNQYFFSGTKGGAVSDTGEYREITRKRVGGRNPYGLYIGLPELSAWQVSILTALGLSFSGKR